MSITIPFLGRSTPVSEDASAKQRWEDHLRTATNWNEKRFASDPALMDLGPSEPSITLFLHGTPHAHVVAAEGETSERFAYISFVSF